MIEELCLDGVYLPAALGWAGLALLQVMIWRPYWRRLRLRHGLWQPEWLELALFFGLWWGLAKLADSLLPDGIVS